VALPYCRFVNNHICLLAVVAGLLLVLVRLAREAPLGGYSQARLVGVGTLAGLGYTIDLAAGPLLALGAVGMALSRCRRWRAAALVAAAAVPWVILHHGVNYAVGGTIKPANAVPEYFNWPGSSFTAQNLTGGWHHSGVGHLLTYALALLAGKRGFLGHNLPLWLALGGSLVLLRRRPREAAELALGLGWAGCTWLVYAVTSTNYSGQCCTIRWFVPFLAPGYYGLTLVLQRFPALQLDFLVLSAWGALLAAVMWYKGPWMEHLVPFYWLFQAGALASWLGIALWRRRRGIHPLAEAVPARPAWRRVA
jgi:hypothetical protein